MFVVTPFVELALLLQIAENIGGWNTFALVIVTGVVGSFLAKSQGFRVWTQIQDDMRHGRMPTDSLADGAMILVAGAVLITPGVLTDAFGLCLLVPAFRRLLQKGLARYVKANVNVQMTSPFANPFVAADDGDVVDSYVADDPSEDDVVDPAPNTDQP
jgi:UPF0716 protein FxsA